MCFKYTKFHLLICPCLNVSYAFSAKTNTKPTHNYATFFPTFINIFWKKKYKNPPSTRTELKVDL